MSTAGLEKSPKASSRPNKNDAVFGSIKLQPACDHRTITGMIFLSTLVSYWERVGFSIAFTDIAFKTGLSDAEKGSVFAAFYCGFAFTQVPGSYFANRYGGKATLALSFLLWVPVSALTAIIPSKSAGYLLPGVIACRLLIGMAQGIMLPAANLVLTHWVPSAHRGRDYAVASSGQFLGAAVAISTVPTIVSDMGAPATFYIAACMGVVWLSAWVCVGSDAPSDPNAADWRKVTQSVGGTFSVVPRTYEEPEEQIDGRTACCRQDGSTISADFTIKTWAFTKITIPQRYTISEYSAIEGGAAVAAATTATKAEPTVLGKGRSKRLNDREPCRRFLVSGPTRNSNWGKKSNAQHLKIGSRTVSRAERRAPASCAVRHSCHLPVSGEKVYSKVKGREGSGTKVADVVVQTETTPVLQGGGTPITRAEYRPGQSTNDTVEAAPDYGEARPSPFPCREVIVSPAAWAYVAGNIGTTLGTSVVVSWLPTYFKELFRIDMQDLGFISLVAPSLTIMTLSVLGGNVYCWLTNTYNISASRAFKLIIGVSFALAFSFLLSMGLATSPTAGTLLSSLALACMAVSRGGWFTYHIEIDALEHAALLYAAANTASAVVCVVGIALTGKMLETFAGIGQSSAWVVALGVIGVICGACAFIFLFFLDETLLPAEARSCTHCSARSRRGRGRSSRDNVDLLVSSI